MTEQMKELLVKMEELRDKENKASLQRLWEDLKPRYILTENERRAFMSGLHAGSQFALYLLANDPTFLKAGLEENIKLLVKEL